MASSWSEICIFLVLGLFSLLMHEVAGGDFPSDFNDNPNVHIQDSRIWTSKDLEPAFSVLSLGQMHPFFERLEGGNSVTVFASGDSITAAGGGCYHRDR